MRMPAKMKAKWLKALRSGEYGQVPSVLTDGKGGFCCLGVLQHVVSGGKCEVYDEDYEDDYKSCPSPEWYDANGIYEAAGSEQENKLMEMNDGHMNYTTEKRSGTKKFGTIANWIEKNVETY